MASADVEGAFDCIKHDDVERGLLQKGVHPESVCSLLRESCDLKGRINLPGASISLALLYARGARQGSVEGPDMSNQVLDKALRELAGRRETEGIGLMLAKYYRKVQKRRRGSSGESVKDEGRVLHHLCWADDLYAMAGTMNHLTRILEDMPSTRRVHHQRSMVLVSGLTRSQCSRHCAFGNWGSFVVSCACAGHCDPAAEETQSTTLANYGNETCACCCLADGGGA